jgi:hypothetical protein
MAMQTSSGWFYCAGPGGNVSLNAGLTSGATYFLSIAHAGGQINTTNTKLYVNGIVQSTSQYPATSFTLAGTGYIGRDSTPGAYWDGKICQVMLWDKQLPASEIAALFNFGNIANPAVDSGNYASSANLKHHFPMNEGSGAALDDTRQTSNGTLNGGYSWTASNFFTTYGVVTDATLIPNAIALELEPNDAAIYVLKQNIDSVSDGADFKVYASIDGTSWVEASLTAVGNFGSTDKLIRAEADVSAQTGTSFKWKITTHNAKSQRIKQVTAYCA